jgi:hypothetical protein
MNNALKITFFFGLVFLMFSCEIDHDRLTSAATLDPEFVDQQFQSENFGDPIRANFIGSIKDSEGRELEGVQVKIGNSTTTTDYNGVFVINDANVFENFAYVTAEKVGYIHGSRVVIPKSGGINRIDIQLFPKAVLATINSNQSSEVTLDSGAKINFTGNFVNANGNPYNGAVEVVANYIRPNDPATFDLMPGSLLAQTIGNDPVNLETYGMISVDLFSPSGEELNIPENSPVTIEFPVDVNQAGIAPESIPLWSFDEAVGYWKEEGTATKQGNTYIAEVTHFSWWNLDVPFELVELCLTLSPENTSGDLPLQMIIQRAVNDQYVYAGVINSGETTCGNVPKGEELNITLFNVANGCANSPIHFETVGGFSMDTSIIVSYTNPIESTQITGTITNCNGNPLTNGYLYLNGDLFTNIDDGTFDISIPHCSGSQVSIQVYDIDSDQWTLVEQIALNGGSVNLPTQNTCNDTGGWHLGSVILSSQEEVDNFGLFQYSTIEGLLRIGPEQAGETTDITDLTPLSSLVNVIDGISISSNAQLENLDGLENLQETIILSITGNDQLTSIGGISNLEGVLQLNIVNNPALITFNDLEGWNGQIGVLNLYGNSNLTSISGLQNTRVLYNFQVTNHEALINLEGLNLNLGVDFVRIDNNDSLTNLAGLEDATNINHLFIGGNDALQSLDGLENLVINEGIFIGVDFDGTNTMYPNGNPVLDDLCALQNLFTNGSFNATISNIFDGTLIENNLYNPSIEDIQNGNCEL